MAAAEHRHGAARRRTGPRGHGATGPRGHGATGTHCAWSCPRAWAPVLILDNQVRHGLTGNAGHLGHISVDFDGEPCPCGASGCPEGVASGMAITRHAAVSWPSPAHGARRCGPRSEASLAAGHRKYGGVPRRGPAAERVSATSSDDGFGRWFLASVGVM
ncbi:ROK family protein [Streptomyces pactum]|uniref:ROK family protein n=1 Tax=Streptomyces pactum TaxID=68249 RepID=A0A1S6J329_9ACTN|nr:hypothetical protein B1H29_03820 [Streptomyces pactum]